MRKEKINKPIATSFALIVLVLSMSVLYGFVYAQPSEVHSANAMWIEPSTINLNVSEINVGYKFNVTVWVNITEDSYDWQVKLPFNTTYFNVTGVGYTGPYGATSDWATHRTGGMTLPVSPVIDNINGYVLYGESCIGTDYVPGSVVASLMWVEFNLTQIPPQNHLTINFSTPYGEDTFIWDPDLNTIPINTINGTVVYFISALKPPVAMFDYEPKPPLANQSVIFNATGSYDPDGTILSYEWSFGDGKTATGEIVTHTYTSSGTYEVNLTVTDNDGLTDTVIKEITVYEVLPAKLYVNPPKIVNSTLRPPSVVKFNITVNNVINMYGYEFKLSYNTEMLTCIGAIINRIQNQTNFTPTILIDDNSGYIWVNVTYHQPAIPITTTTPETLVTIYLQIDTMGSSILHLYDTKLWNSSGQEITHQTEDGFIMTLIRDIAIIKVTPSTSWAYQGWPVYINISAVNNGNISETFTIKAYWNNNLIGQSSINDLPPGTTTTVVLLWNTTVVPEGNYTIRAEASTVPYEYNVTNNVLTNGAIQIITKIRDIAITNLLRSRSWVFPGMPLNITVTAKNLGDTVESFNVKIYCNSSLLANYSIIQLQPSKEINVTFTWNTTDLKPCSYYVIKAEASTVPYEYNVTNNVLTDGTIQIRILGDVNGDNKTDMKDVAIVAKAFGSYPGHPRWNPDADITGTSYLKPDNMIDMRDVALIARNFGKTC